MSAQLVASPELQQTDFDRVRALRTLREIPIEGHESFDIVRDGKVQGIGEIHSVRRLLGCTNHRISELDGDVTKARPRRETPA